MGILILVTFLLWISSFAVIIDYGTHTDEFGNDHTNSFLILIWIFISIFSIILCLLAIGAI